MGGGANAYALNLQAGEAEVFKGGWPQVLRSTSEAPSQWVVAEAIHGIRPERASCGLNGSTCGTVKFGKSDDGEYDESTLFENATVRLSRAELGPNSALDTHADRRDHMVVPIAGGAFAINGQSAANSAPRWVHGSAELHSGSEKAKFLILEFK